MPIVYLSPSLQEFNEYVDGGNEEYYMNLIVDEMIPYLKSSGIQYVRNNPSQTLNEVIDDSNEGNFGLHLAIHSNASPGDLAGKLRGTDVYYYTTSKKGKKAADIIAENFRKIYPDPSAVKTVPTTTLAELKRTRAPAVLVETAYHDNEEDAKWIRNNIEKIAENLVMSIAEYFGIPFVPAQPERAGVVATKTGPLNIRVKPDIYSEVLTQAPKGSILKIYGQWKDWYVVNYDDTIGYASSYYIDVR